MDQDYLKPDVLTGGVITKILEDSWRGKSAVTKEELKIIHKILLDNQMFGEVAESIIMPISDKKDELEEKLLNGIKSHLERGDKEPENKTNHVKLFSSPGLILKDGIHGSAFGRFNYIYRSKGFRIYWFESGVIEYRPVYATINEYGFQYVAEEFDGCDIFGDYEFDDPSGTPLEEAFGTGKKLISNLIGIKEDFVRDYPIEYLLYPPDVENLSSFSIKIQEQIWDAVIELIKEIAIDFNDNKASLLEYLAEFMGSQGIQPKAYHVITLFDFYKENHLKINEKEFNKLMLDIRKFSFPELSTATPIDVAALIRELEELPKGSKSANDYHDLIFRCLTQIFYPSLKHGKKEVRMNDGRKRADIVFDNHDTTGIFAHIRVRYNIFCPKIFVECKNYSNDLKNPEIDQLLGRLGDITGKLGIIVCRKIGDEELLMKRCKDEVYHNKRFVIFLEDKDIKALLQLKEDADVEGITEYLSVKWDRLILNN